MTAKIRSALRYAKAAQPTCFAGLGASNILGLSLPWSYLNVRGHVSANVRGMVSWGLWWSTEKSSAVCKCYRWLNSGCVRAADKTFCRAKAPAPAHTSLVSKYPNQQISNGLNAHRKSRTSWRFHQEALRRLATPPSLRKMHKKLKWFAAIVIHSRRNYSAHFTRVVEINCCEQTTIKFLFGSNSKLQKREVTLNKVTSL